MQRRRIANLAFFTLLASPLGAAQVQVYAVSGAAPGDAFGSVVRTIADLDSDGVRELLVSAPREDFGALPNAGSVYVLSGAHGAQLRHVGGSANGELFGSALDAAGDVDGDGFEDFVVGIPFDSTAQWNGGAAEVRSGSDGSVLLSFFGNEQFALAGTAVAGVGQIDGDNVPDIIVAAPFEDSNGTDAGSVHVYSGSSAGLIRSHNGSIAGEEFGQTVISLGDVDGDGRGDYAAAAPTADGAGTQRGLVRVYSGQSGNVLYTLNGTVDLGEFGRALARIADVTGDGVGDLAVGAPGDSAGGSAAGAVEIHNGTTGALVHIFVGQAGEALGVALADAGDRDGDAQGDLLIGASGLGGFGAAHIYSGADWSPIETVLGTAPDQEFGSALTGGLDIDGDGIGEIAIGDRLSDETPTDGGVVRVYSDHSLLGTAYCSGDGTATTCPCGNLGSTGAGCANSSGSGATLTGIGTTSVSSDDLELVAQDLLPGKTALLFAGTTRLNGGAGVIFGDGLRCAGGAIKRLGVRVPDGAGLATWGPGLATAGTWGSGDTRRFQIWYRDGNASPCGSGFNLSNGFEVGFSL